jgi:hypothetical protein
MYLIAMSTYLHDCVLSKIRRENGFLSQRREHSGVYMYESQFLSVPERAKRESANTSRGFECLEIRPHRRIRDPVPERAEEVSSCPPYWFFFVLSHTTCRGSVGFENGNMFTNAFSLVRFSCELVLGLFRIRPALRQSGTDPWSGEGDGACAGRLISKIFGR